MDSFAIATMHGELELDLAIALPPTLLLVEGSTPRTLARALCDLAVAPDAPGGDPGEDETPTVAGEDETPTVATLPGSMRAPSRPLVVCAVLVAVAVATTPAPWAMFTSSALSSRAFGEERMRGLWGLGRRRVDRAAHWRLLEWSRTVAPFQVAAAVVIATVRVVAARVCKVPPKTTAFWCALAHAALAHGVPGAAFVLAPTCAVFFAGRAFDRPRDRKRATWVAGACLLLACNLTEPSASAASASASKRARRRGGVVARARERRVPRSRVLFVRPQESRAVFVDSNDIPRPGDVRGRRGRHVRAVRRVRVVRDVPAAVPVRAVRELRDVREEPGDARRLRTLRRVLYTGPHTTASAW